MATGGQIKHIRISDKMERHFNLMLPVTWKVSVILLSGLALSVVVAFAGMELFTGYDKMVGMGWLLLAIGGGFYGAFRLAKKLGAREVLVIVASDSITVLDHGSGAEKLVRYDEIVTYRYMAYNGAQELRLRMKDGSKQKIGINNNLHSDQDLGTLVSEFEAALTLRQQDQTAPNSQALSGPLREKTFFEKPISTIVFILLAAGMGYLLWIIVAEEKPVRGSLFTAAASFIAYFVAWYAARERRNA